MSNLILSAPQGIFLNQLDTKFRAYVGGFGSGKTFVGCVDLLNFFSLYPATRQGYFGVTYPAIRDIFYPTFEEAGHMLGFSVGIKEANKEIHVYRNGFYYGTVICRSMDNPTSIVGFKVARALVDEIDILKSDKAKDAWNKIIARLRLKIDGVVNGIGVTTTPEGFKFVYSRFAKNPTESYSMVQASTYENLQYLPDDYISSLRESYPANLIDAYIEGKFVNLTQGCVYRDFDRVKNATCETISDGDTLHIGMDFNVGKMAAVVHIEKNNEVLAVDEIMGGFDTADMIDKIKMRYPGHTIFVYPDSSGDNRQTVSADTTDLKLLKRAGFKVRAKGSNPPVRNRINCVNALICNMTGERRYKINVTKCPVTVDALEHQAYDEKGNPDKEHDEDHPTDALGYYVAYRHPIAKMQLRAW